MNSPCTLCPKESNPCFICCDGKPGCADWQAWFLAEWKKFNDYALAHGLTIERLVQYGDES